MRNTLLSLLLLSAAISVTPASANYFSNPRLGMNLNVGSAPNPTPGDIRRVIVVEQNTTVYTTQATTQAAPIPAPAPPPRVVAEVPAPPAPPPAIRQFVVFFDFDKSNLTPEAMQVVGAAVMNAKSSGMARIVVTGHTDTVGSKAYNQALSERRAVAVKTEMMHMGLAASDISTIGKSFSEPLVATGPGVREPQNRRAVIELGYNVMAAE